MKIRKKYYHIHTREMLVIYTTFYKYYMCLLVLNLNLTKLPVDESCSKSSDFSVYKTDNDQ